MRIQRGLPLSVLLLAALAICCDARAEEQWGNLSMTFRLNGERPRAKERIVDKRNVLSADPPDADSLVVHPKNRGIANVAVWLRDKITPDEIHPDFAADAQKPVVLSICNRQYVPRVVALRTSQNLVVTVDDEDGHGPATDFIMNAPSSALIPGEGSVELQLCLQEALPSHFACILHPTEHCWVIIRDNPYVGVSDENGELTIPRLPIGKHTFALWHERTGPLKSEQTGGKQDWPQGRFTVDIQPGENKLRVFNFSPDVFQEK